MTFEDSYYQLLPPAFPILLKIMISADMCGEPTVPHLDLHWATRDAKMP